MKKILIIFGTRPEAIKFAPLFKEFKKHEAEFDTKVCITAQHRQMLDQVLDFFQIKPDYDLNLMKENQDIFDITLNVLGGLREVLKQEKPDLIFVQGDTTTTFAGALAGYYYKIPIAHLEAGLRSYNKYSPFPEEINRILTSHTADYHFAPTEKAVKNLLSEGMTENIWQVGNTVIDALFLALELLNRQNINYESDFPAIDFNKKIILVTGHRRESFGKPFENIALALKEIAESHPDFVIFYPVHLNPNVQKPVYNILSAVKNIHLMAPLDYPHLIWLLNKSYFVLTDSGGIQEEAPSLGKPVLIMRDVTERTEGIEAGTAVLVGTDKDIIVKNAEMLINDSEVYNKMSKAVNPYGDGLTSKKIVDIFLNLE